MMREIVGGMNAVSLRQAGGVYFAPDSERDSFLRLRQLIAGIPQVAEPGSFVCALGVPDAAEANCPFAYSILFRSQCLDRID